MHGTEAPDEEYDPRTLFERLQEQKMKKEAEFEEQHQLKNMIRGLDNDEVAFLEYIDRNRIQEENQKNAEEKKAIEEFQQAMSGLSQEDQQNRIEQFKKSLWSPETKVTKDPSGSTGVTKKSQAALLSKVVKRKSENAASTSSETSSKKVHIDTPDKSSQQTARIIGVLPGIGAYGSDSSDSENSTDTDGSDSFRLISRRPREKCSE